MRLDAAAPSLGAWSGRSFLGSCYFNIRSVTSFRVVSGLLACRKMEVGSAEQFSEPSSYCWPSYFSRY